MTSEEKLFEDYVKCIQKIMKFDVDPCENFIDYACGNYAGEDKLDEFYHNPIILTERLLDNQDITLPSFVKARDFYNSAKKFSTFKEFLDHCDLNESIGGWPALTANWTGESFNPLNTAANLSSVGLSTIFNENLHYEESEKIYSIAATETKELTNLQDDLQKLGVSEELIADVIRDVELVSRKLEAVPAQHFERANTISEESTKSFSSLEEEDGLDYKTYFETFFGHSVNDEDLCSIENEEYLSDYYKVFVQNEPKSVANYLFWRAGRKFLKHKFPLKLTCRYFIPVILAAGFSTYFNKDDENKLQKVLSTFLKSFLKIQHEFTPDAVSQSETYIADVNDAIQYKNSHFQQEIIDHEYNTLQIDPDNFLKNITNIKAFPTTKSQLLMYEEEVSGLWDFLWNLIPDHNKPFLHHMISTAFYKWYDVIDSFKTDLKDHNKYPESVINNQMNVCNVPKHWNEEVATKSKAYALAIKQIFLDYKIWLKDNEQLENIQDTILRKLNLDNNKILFVALAQTYRKADVNTRSELSLALWNSSDFSAAFSCKLGSRMNPKGNYSI